MAGALFGHARLFADPASRAFAFSAIIDFLFLFLLDMIRFILIKYLLSHLFQLLAHISSRRIVIFVNIDHNVVIVNSCWGLLRATTRAR